MRKYIPGRGVSMGGIGLDQWAGSGRVVRESAGLWVNPYVKGVQSASGRGVSQMVGLNPQLFGLNL